MIVLNQEEKLDRQIYLKAKLLYPWASFHLIEFWEGYFKLLSLTSLFWFREFDAAGWLFLGEGIWSPPPNKWLFKWEALLLLPPTISYAMSLFGISYSFTFPEKALSQKPNYAWRILCWSFIFKNSLLSWYMSKNLLGCIKGLKRSQNGMKLILTRSKKYKWTSVVQLQEEGVGVIIWQ